MDARGAVPGVNDGRAHVGAAVARLGIRHAAPDCRPPGWRRELARRRRLQDGDGVVFRGARIADRPWAAGSRTPIARSAPGIVINQAFANRYFDEEDPIGKQF